MKKHRKLREHWLCRSLARAVLAGSLFGCAAAADEAGQKRVQPDPKADEREERDDDSDSEPAEVDARDAGSTAQRDGATRDATTRDATTPAGPDEAELLPWKPGNRWVYRVTGDGTVSMKTTTLGDEEEVGGGGPNRALRALKVTTDKGAADKSVSWQARVGDSVLRYREIAYSAARGTQELEEHWAPHKLHVHSDAEHRRPGTKWVESYQETKLMADGGVATSMASDNWLVDGVDVAVTVPAGSFRAVVLIKASPSGQKTYWYVPGIGKVKETGGQTEELVSYELTP